MEERPPANGGDRRAQYGRVSPPFNVLMYFLGGRCQKGEFFKNISPFIVPEKNDEKTPSYRPSPPKRPYDELGEGHGIAGQAKILKTYRKTQHFKTRYHLQSEAFTLATHDPRPLGPQI